MAGKISQSGDFIIMNKLSPCLNTCAIIDNWQPKLSLENYCNFAIFKSHSHYCVFRAHLRQMVALLRRERKIPISAADRCGECEWAFNNNNELPRILTLQYSYFLTYFAKRIFLMIHGSRIIINVSFKVL